MPSNTTAASSIIASAVRTFVACQSCLIFDAAKKSNLRIRIRNRRGSFVYACHGKHKIWHRRLHLIRCRRRHDRKNLPALPMNPVLDNALPLAGRRRLQNPTNKRFDCSLVKLRLGPRSGTQSKEILQCRICLLTKELPRFTSERLLGHRFAWRCAGKG